MSLASLLVRLSLTVVVSLTTLHRAPAETADLPVIAIGQSDIDPGKYDWLRDNVRSALQDAINKQKSGSLYAFVFAVSPAGDVFAYRSAINASDPYSLSDLARQSLQACEFFAKSSCFVLSINGKEARTPDGSLPLQPRQLVKPPAVYDAFRVPFVSPADQLKLAGYSAETKPKVLVVTPNSSWLWRTGDNVFQAAASAYADCQKTFVGETCILYALNNEVTFEPGGPF